MAAPNIVNVTTIIGKSAVLAVTTTATAIVDNIADSGKVIKINSLLVSNVDGVNNANITVDLYRNSTPYHIVSSVSVPYNSSLDILNKSIYLEEGDSLRLTANADLDLEAICSYEEIS